MAVSYDVWVADSALKCASVIGYTNVDYVKGADMDVTGDAAECGHRAVFYYNPTTAD